MTASFSLFSRADILMPQNVDLTAYCVVACDQYTSEPLYWERVKSLVGEKPSTLSMIFPEVYLKTADFKKTVSGINYAMESHLKAGLFKTYKNSYFLVERRLKNGAVRTGLVGMTDLEKYSFDKNSESPIRATEGTVLDRIPPRVKVRENAPLEFPHVMLLLDDPQKCVIEPLLQKTDSMEKVYDFALMEESGQIKGYRLTEAQAAELEKKLAAFSQRERFEEKYQAVGKPILSLAVGDGNHSLATARQCYLNLKEKIGDKALESPARYALCELVNLHDSSLDFEAIHRIVTGINPQDIINALYEKYRISGEKGDCEIEQKIEIVTNGNIKTVYIKNPSHTLAVGSLQLFLDEYTAKSGGEIDYIHGADVVAELSKRENSIGFLLPCMDKGDLFKSVIFDGALPRKTFSMGEACDKRFYLEARKIK